MSVTNVNARQKAQGLLQGHLRTAAEFPPPNPQQDNGGEPPGSGGGAPTGRRQIPTDHEFDKKAVKPLVETLWALSVALGHVLTAHRHFSRLKSVSFSPDGMIGGRGYVMSVRDVRSQLFEASDQISAICDSLFDEINGPHWKPKLAELEEGDADDVMKLLDDAQDNLDDPEAEAEEDQQKVETGPKPASRFQPEGGGDASQLPGGGKTEPLRTSPTKTKEAGVYTYDRTADSSLPVGTLPGGPRVDHLDREQQGPFGSYNVGEPVTDDGWGHDSEEARDRDYRSPWDNDLSERSAESTLPHDPTPTEAWDFGLGYGANGQGAGGYGADNPSSGGMGVDGPRADLPGASGGATWNEDGTAETLDHGGHQATSVMPNDGTKPPARADYYPGVKDNDMDVSSTSDLPGGEPASLENDRDTPNAGYTYERRDPRVLYDDSTHNERPDSLYQQDPSRGPYPRSLHGHLSPAQPPCGGPRLAQRQRGGLPQPGHATQAKPGHHPGPGGGLDA